MTVFTNEIQKPVNDKKCSKSVESLSMAWPTTSTTTQWLRALHHISMNISLEAKRAGTELMLHAQKSNKKRITKCDITKCDITKCDITKCVITKCYITKCYITKCDITKCDITKCDITKYN
ncbi:ATP-binding cassette sub-family E member 1 [Brachionus plicatilis]|uniref:ATP-binding cassette sub-family E member 1 n=1 Tax=Brachionus plicatilis TaxID=10195 RepID=A0A3M7R418_BRAPC|nr:ATP-binding cassette sub-family E member 1 [Brachionus plicatilis]